MKGKRSDAERQLRELLTTQDRGIPLSSSKFTVGQWMERWFTEYVLANTRQKTIERYRGIIQKYINPSIGHLQLTKLAPRDIQGFEAHLIDGGMAPKGLNLVHTTISGALKYGVRMEVL